MYYQGSYSLNIDTATEKPLEIDNTTDILLEKRQMTIKILNLEKNRDMLYYTILSTHFR
jgi:flagellar assembly factor FliW